MFHGSVDCGTFIDNYEDRYDIRVTDEFDADGNLARVLYHAEDGGPARIASPTRRVD